MSGSRRKARTAALQALYEIDCVRHDAEATTTRLIDELGLSEASADFVREIVRGVISNKLKIDKLIRQFAPAWPVEQLSPVDRNILRLAIFEFLIDNKVTFKIAINEAVELAKTFGSQSSSRFVNGVLGSIHNSQKPNGV